MRRILLSLMLVALGTTSADACECPFGTRKSNFRWAKIIFTGEVVSVGERKFFNPKLSPVPLRAVTFKVEKVWKGAKQGEVTVLTDSCASMCCTIEFHEGRKYLVYVWEGAFVSSNCAWTAELGSERAEQNVRDLNSLWFRLKARLWGF
jgi:hypothetical protein